MGICYENRYEFPEKKFYWCSSTNGMVFELFPALNKQHETLYDSLSSLMFQGEPGLVHEKVEKEIDPAEAEAKAAAKAERAENELASTEEEDPESLIVRINLKEIDRVHYHVRAIENDCHIIPYGAMRLNEMHEVQRSEAFNGLPANEAFSLQYYSHFRSV